MEEEVGDAAPRALAGVEVADGGVLLAEDDVLDAVGGVLAAGGVVLDPDPREGPGSGDLSMALFAEVALVPPLDPVGCLGMVPVAD